jgi:MFS transporter, DHA1 family, tetracycline resistance protein
MNKTMPQNNSKATFFTVLLTIFIDMLGVGIVIPVMAPLFLDPTYHLVDAAHTTQWRTIALGFLFASFSLAQFFGAPILGAWGDRIGRKKVLVMALCGTFLGYLLFAYAIEAQLLWLLFAARILDGFTGGNVSIIFSIITDISETSEARTRNFGMVGAAFGMGFIIGPYIGGKLADPTLVSWFTYATPFWFAAILTLINVLLVLVFVPETRTFSASETNKKINIFAGIENIIAIRKFPKLQVLLLVTFLFTFGFTFFTQFFQVFLIQKFQYSQSAIGDIFAYIGLWIAFTQGGLTRILSKRFAAVNIPKWSIFGLSAAFFLLLLPNDYRLLYAILPLVALFQGTTSPNLVTLVSEQSDPQTQGAIMGIQQSVQSLAQAIPPIIAGFIVSINTNLPITVAAAVMLVTGLIFIQNAVKWGGQFSSEQ